ncbi:MAG: pknF 1 [Gemmataceae bacterium]|nr:pknF 1 [Gemmataceae bacterium]
MPPSPTTDSGTYSAYTKLPGTEPLPGYVLFEPLGRGGFGEVWKCEAPGGLHKAIKFVAGATGSDAASGNQFLQEFEAFQQIKAIRHPFLLTLERVELVGGDLVMVMELADRQLLDRFHECRTHRLPGIPRAELLGYFGEAAEALDVIGTQYGLQHLDVKPANLFLTAGHVKVGDYGLVSKLQGKADGAMNRGLTPKYVAPEVLRGQVDTRSDQYSLALVYQELLTGTFPYSGRTPQQMMLQHVSTAPDLTGLPECDRPAVLRALAKKVEDRFPSCLDFVRALIAADYVPPPTPSQPGYPAVSATPAPGGSIVVPFHQRPVDLTPGPAEATGRHGLSGELTQNATLRTLSPLTVPGRPLPPLVAASRWPAPATPLVATPPAPPPVAAPRRPADENLPPADVELGGRLRVNPIRSVVPVARLVGTAAPDAGVSGTEFAAAVVAAAAAGGHVPQLPGDLGRLADGTWVCQFPSTVPAQVVPHKLVLLRDQWAMTMEQPDAGRVVLRKTAPAGLWGALSGKKAGLELTVQLPKTGKSVGEVTVTGAVFGAPDRAFVRTAEDMIPKIIADIRREVGNVADRRKTPRVAVAFPVTLYPLHSDGTVDPAIAGRCRDVSAGGVGFAAAEPVATRYVYVEFGGVVATAGLAALVKVVRSQSLLTGHEHTYGGQYRTDL